MIKDYRPYSCCTVRIYRGCPLCPRAYTQPPQPHWGRPSDPAPVSVLLPPPLYISSRPLTVEWYLGFYKKNINHLEPILYTILKMVDHIRRYLVALLTEQSQRIDAIYQVLFNLSPWQTAAFYLSLSDLEERNILSRFFQIFSDLNISRGTDDGPVRCGVIRVAHFSESQLTWDCKYSHIVWWPKL